MDKLQWCRENAPEAIRNESDELILITMETAWNDYCREHDVVSDTSTLNEINSDMDYMVTTLVSAFGDKLAFKGGYMLTKLIPDQARQTTDIDFSIQKSELYSDLQNTMRTIGDRFVAEGRISRYTVKDEIREFMSGGMDMYNAEGKKVLGIDVGWHDVTYGTTRTTIDIGDVRAFTIERMISDKVSAILSKKRFRRPKDIYDLYCITNCFDFNTSLVNDFILKRTGGAGADWGNFPFNETVLREYRKAYMSLRLSSIYRGHELPKPDFDAVMERFSTIYQGLRYLLKTPTWDHTKGMFV